MRIVFLPVAAACIAACTPPPVASPQPRPITYEELNRRAPAQIDSDEAAAAVDILRSASATGRAACQPDGYTAALEKIRALRNSPRGSTPYQWGLHEARVYDSGRLMLQVGEIARTRRCNAIAREAFLEVIEVYVGSDFAALRQRAQVGVDDIRAAR